MQAEVSKIGGITVVKNSPYKAGTFTLTHEPYEPCAAMALAEKCVRTGCREIAFDTGGRGRKGFWNALVYPVHLSDEELEMPPELESDIVFKEPASNGIRSIEIKDKSLNTIADISKIHGKAPRAFVKLISWYATPNREEFGFLLCPEYTIEAVADLLANFGKVTYNREERGFHVYDMEKKLLRALHERHGLKPTVLMPMDWKNYF